MTATNQIDGTTPDVHLILACVRRFLGSDERIEWTAVQWNSLLPLAKSHGVEPLLYWAADHDGVPVPPQLAERFSQNTRRSLILTSELLKLLAILESAHISVIPVKGPVLAEAIYGDLALRAFGDLDLYLPFNSVPKATGILTTAGFELISPIHWRNKFHNRDSELSFYRQRGSVRVDVHWELIPRYYAQVVDHGIWDRCIKVDLGGRMVPSLPDEDLLLFLCVHGAKHHWERLGWLCDVAQLIRVRPNLDWERILNTAAALHCARILALGLFLVRDLLGVSLPSAVESRLGTPPTPEYVPGAGASLTALQSLRFGLRLMETPFAKARLLSGLLFAPTEAEYRAIQLPPSLYFLYYPIRCGRLAIKYAARSF